MKNQKYLTDFNGDFSNINIGECVVMVCGLMYEVAEIFSQENTKTGGKFYQIISSAGDVFTYDQYGVCIMYSGFTRKVVDKMRPYGNNMLNISEVVKSDPINSNNYKELLNALNS